MCVPRRSDAFSRTTASQTRSIFTGPANTASSRSTDPTFWLSLFTTSNVIAITQLRTSKFEVRTSKFARPRRALLLAFLGLLRLRLRIGLARHGAAHDHDALRRARHRAAHDEQMLLDVHAHDFQVARRHAVAAHAARGSHALYDA